MFAALVGDIAASEDDVDGGIFPLACCFSLSVSQLSLRRIVGYGGDASSEACAGRARNGGAKAKKGEKKEKRKRESSAVVEEMI